MREGLSFSHEAGTGGAARVDIALGARTGTKTNRAQNVSVYIDSDPDRCLAVRWTHDSTSAGELIFPFSIETYWRLIKSIDAQLGVHAGWSPHSPRAGYATEATSNRVSFSEIKETMRRSTDSALRSYIDVVGAKAVALNLQTAGLSDALAFARVHWLKYVQVRFLVQTYQ
jgi:hypothetical protein